MTKLTISGRNWVLYGDGLIRKHGSGVTVVITEPAVKAVPGLGGHPADWWGVNGSDMEVAKSFYTGPFASWRDVDAVILKQRMKTDADGMPIHTTWEEDMIAVAEVRWPGVRFTLAVA